MQLSAGSGHISDAKGVNNITTYFLIYYQTICPGTPVHNAIEDLWALLNFLMPDLFGSEKTFTQWCAL